MDAIFAFSQYLSFLGAGWHCPNLPAGLFRPWGRDYMITPEQVSILNDIDNVII